MNPRTQQGFGLFGMLLVSVGFVGGFWNLAFPVSAHWRHGFLLSLFAGMSLIFAASRSGRKKA